MSTRTSARARHVTVVTGASSPIGAAIARRLAAGGDAVLLTGRDRSALERAVTIINAEGGDAGWTTADLTCADAIAEVRACAESRYGPVDRLVTAAGGGGRPTPLAVMTPDAWRATTEQNLTTTFLALREFVPAMAAQGRGAVVTVSSDAARRVSGASPAYTAAKAAVLALTRDAAAEFAASGVRVNAVAPGTVHTPSLDRAGPEVLTQLASSHPLGRLGTVDDVAHAVAFLLDDGSSWITGHTLDLGARVLTTTSSAEGTNS